MKKEILKQIAESNSCRLALAEANGKCAESTILRWIKTDYKDLRLPHNLQIIGRELGLSKKDLLI